MHRRAESLAPFRPLRVRPRSMPAHRRFPARWTRLPVVLRTSRLMSAYLAEKGTRRRPVLALPRGSAHRGGRPGWCTACACAGFCQPSVRQSCWRASEMLPCIFAHQRRHPGSFEPALGVASPEPDAGSGEPGRRPGSWRCHLLFVHWPRGAVSDVQRHWRFPPELAAAAPGVTSSVPGGARRSCRRQLAVTAAISKAAPDSTDCRYPASGNTWWTLRHLEEARPARHRWRDPAGCGSRKNGGQRNVGRAVGFCGWYRTGDLFKHNRRVGARVTVQAELFKVNGFGSTGRAGDLASAGSERAVLVPPAAVNGRRPDRSPALR